MLVIRLQRTGRKGHAQFRVVVQDSRRTPPEEPKEEAPAEEPAAEAVEAPAPETDAPEAAAEEVSAE